MEQAPVLYGLSFDPFSHVGDGLISIEANIGGCEIA